MSAPILLCIATGQNLANLIPALQLRPAEVWILATPKMRQQAQTLKKSLDRHAIPARIEAFADTDIPTLEAESLRIAELLDKQPTLFNATGGTKQMAFILADNTLQVLGPEVQGVLYADTRNQRIDWLRPAGRGSQPIDNLLTLEDILGIQGFRLGKVSNRQEEWIKTVEERSQLTRQLGDQAEQLENLFGALNVLAQKATTNPDTFHPQQQLNRAPHPRLSGLLHDAERHDLLRWDGNTGIEFNNRDAARYFGGGWIEEYLFFKLRGCHPKDYAINPIFIAPDDKTTNEMDAIVVHRNRLLAIECKTIRFGRDRGKDADILYKLDSLAQRTGGLMHESLLLSARPLDEANLARAGEYNIKVIAGKDIRTLPHFIRTWMES